MIISHQHKFIFIKTVKTAGTSLEVYLSKYCGKRDVLTPLSSSDTDYPARNHLSFFNPLREIISCPGRNSKQAFRDFFRRRRFFNHIPAQLVRARISPKIWSSYYKFCVERNPWDKTISHYFHELKRAKNNLSLEQYFDRGAFCSDYWRYTDVSGEILVDQVLRYECLQQELEVLFARLKIPFVDGLQSYEHAGYRLDRRPYQYLLSAAQRDIVASVFSKEISTFKYKFDAN